MTVSKTRKSRLLTDSFAHAALDTAGITAAAESGRAYRLDLTGLSLRSLGGAFRSVVNLLDPPRYVEDYFGQREILGHPAFETFRDRLNEMGLDIEDTNGKYRLFIDNKHIGRGNPAPWVSFHIVPWDGVKKGFEPYDIFKEIPPAGPKPGY